MPVAELRGVTKRYGDIEALRGIDLEIGSGQILALLGPNGAGKTTAVRILLGLLRPTSGAPRSSGIRRRASTRNCGAGLCCRSPRFPRR
jgi:ABC-2 type transport system ATP-binding protein